MAARATWTGSVELGGFPVNIALFNRTPSRRGDSFRMIAPDGGPVSQQLVDQNGKPVERAETGRAVEVGGELVPLSDEAIETIGKAERSVNLEPRQFADLDSIDLTLAQASYTVVPDGKVAGSDKPVEILWNGLLARNLAYVSQITMRSGSRDSILVIYARKDGLYAAALPFAQELSEPPVHEFTEDKKAQDLFGQFVDAQYGEITGGFDFGSFESEYRKRRESVLDAVLAGVEIKVPEAAAPQAESADLMALLETRVATEAKAKAKKATSAKAKAKKAAAKPRTKAAA